MNEWVIMIPPLKKAWKILSGCICVWSLSGVSFLCGACEIQAEISSEHDRSSCQRHCWRTSCHCEQEGYDAVWDISENGLINIDFFPVLVTLHGWAGTRVLALGGMSRLLRILGMFWWGWNSRDMIGRRRFVCPRLLWACTRALRRSGIIVAFFRYRDRLSSWVRTIVIIVQSLDFWSRFWFVFGLLQRDRKRYGSQKTGILQESSPLHRRTFQLHRRTLY